MKKLLLLFVFAVLFQAAGFAQDKKEIRYHLISLEDKKDAPLHYNYYIENVYDGRQFKGNIGTVQKGAFNNKVLARFEKPFEEEIKNYMLKAFPKKEGAQAISLRISDLYVSELTEAFSETGFASVVADVIVTSEGQDYVVATVAGNVDSGGLDVTGKHDERIKMALEECVANFKVIREEHWIRAPFKVNEPVVNKPAGKAAKGIYVSYIDMLNGTPLDDAGLYLKQDGNKYYLMNSATGKKFENYYAYSDGEVVYLNVSKYANGKYYAKTDIIGGKYYIDNVVYNANNAAMMTAMFGLVGALVSSGSSRVPMLMDGNSGQPFFLSNNEIKTLLEPYPDLLKEYKNSKKESEDIKSVLIKYYALQESK